MCSRDQLSAQAARRRGLFNWDVKALLSMSVQANPVQQCSEVEYLQRHLSEESRGLHPLREGDRLWGRRGEQKDSAGVSGSLQA